MIVSVACLLHFIKRELFRLPIPEHLLQLDAFSVAA